MAAAIHVTAISGGRLPDPTCRGGRRGPRRLFISEAGVKTHLPHVYAKLGVNDRAAAVAAADERGLLTPGGNSD